MFKFPKKKTEVTTEVLIKLIWVSSFLAMIFTLPSIRIIPRNLLFHWGTHYRSHNRFWSSFCNTSIFRKNFKDGNQISELNYKG